jgi:uncharacterized membrane protein YtjA (UPF0391 family)
MLKWALIFFVISLVAGFFGFTGAAASFRGIAKILFFIALAIFLIVLIFGVFLGTLVF